MQTLQIHYNYKTFLDKTVKLITPDEQKSNKQVKRKKVNLSADLFRTSTKEILKSLLAMTYSPRGLPPKYHRR